MIQAISAPLMLLIAAILGFGHMTEAPDLVNPIAPAPLQSGCKLMAKYDPFVGRFRFAGCKANACNQCFEVPIDPETVICSCNAPGGDGSCDASYSPVSPALPWGAVSNCFGGCAEPKTCQENIGPLWPEPFVLCDCKNPPVWW